MLENRKIKKILSMENGEAYAFVFVCILILAARISKKGKLQFLKGKPYTAEDIAAECGLKEQTVKSAIELFLEYEMLKEIRGVLCVKNFLKYQNPSEYTKKKQENSERVKRHREMLKQNSKSCEGADLSDEEMEKLRILLLESDIKYYLSVLKKCIETGKRPKNAYKFIVDMAKADKKLKIMQKRGINQGSADENEYLKLPNEELSPIGLAFKRALERSLSDE
jgi:hypothetical protein